MINYININSLANQILDEFIDSDICNYYQIPCYAPKVVLVNNLSAFGFFNISKIKNNYIFLIEINDSLDEYEIKKTLTHELLHYILFLNDAGWADNDDDFIYWANIFDVL